MVKFDLNIERVLEDWEVHHAIREVIANALDEQALTGTAEVEIREGGTVTIRDYGRGLRQKHLTQNENEEKLSATAPVIGKFGVGLKDALATFERHGVGVLIKSKYSDITITKSSKHGFDDITTLHADIQPPSEPDMQGTEVSLTRCPAGALEKAKGLFLKFSGEEILGETGYGKILTRRDPARIYINGMLVATEDNFLFSYDITSLTASMKKALNRERTHVGRQAYANRVKTILLASDSETVARELAGDLERFQTGTQHDETKYTDVAVRACSIINSSSKAVFVTPRQLQDDMEGISNARAEGLDVVVVPDAIAEKLRGELDRAGKPIRDMAQFHTEFNKSFQYKMVSPDDLTPAERLIYGKTDLILRLVGGRPEAVKEILISETMRSEDSGLDVGGVWEADKGRIIIRRDELLNLESYAGVLLHEVAHATSRAGDVSREFETELTRMMGMASGAALERS